MTSKVIDKSRSSDRSTVSRCASGNRAKSARDKAATATALKREAPAEQYSAQRRITKHALLLQLLSRPEGASIEDMTLATAWQRHSVRGFLAGTVKKRMGLALSSSKDEGEVRRYRIPTRRGR